MAGGSEHKEDPALAEFMEHINTQVTPLFTKAMAPVKYFLLGEKKPTYKLFDEPTALPTYAKYDIAAIAIRYVKDDGDRATGVLPTLTCGLVPRATLDKLPYITSPIERTLADFQWLRATLVLELPGLIVPPFPPSVSHGAHLANAVTPGEAVGAEGADGYADQTRAKLEVFLQRVVGHPIWSAPAELDAPARAAYATVKMFCLAPVDVFQRFQAEHPVAKQPKTSA